MTSSIGNKGLVLAIFALVSTLLIGFTYEGTKDKISEQQDRQLNRMLSSVLPTELYDNNLIDSCVLFPTDTPLSSAEPLKVFIAKRGEQVTAAAIESNAPNGYSGNIKFLLGIAGTDTVTGVRVLAHKETPGLGDKVDIRVSDWILSFEQQIVSSDTLSRWAVKKDGGQFDQFTGATITPRALVSSVKKTVVFYQENYLSILDADLDCQSDPNEG